MDSYSYASEFFVFNPTLSHKEDDHHKKLLFYHPATTPIDDQINQVGLCEGMTHFAEQFSTPDQPIQSIHTAMRALFLINPEPNLWFVMVMENPRKRVYLDTDEVESSSSATAASAGGVSPSASVSAAGAASDSGAAGSNAGVSGAVGGAGGAGGSMKAVADQLSQEKAEQMHEQELKKADGAAAVVTRSETGKDEQHWKDGLHADGTHYDLSYVQDVPRPCHCARPSCGQ